MASESQELDSFVAEAADAGERLDVYLAKRASGVSRAKIQQLIAVGAVSLNGKPTRAKERLTAGDEVKVTWAIAVAPSPLQPVAMPLVIMYEDDDLIVLNKPAGISVHPGAGDTGPTLVQGLLYHCGQLSAGSSPEGAMVRPGIVHRLDKDTTGVMVCAKTDRVHAALAKQFQEKKTLRREYTALMDGAMQQNEVLYSSYLFRDPTNRLRFASMTEAAYGALSDRQRPSRVRLAKSLFTREALFGQRLTLGRVRLYTGRTHQIRVHAQALGLPIVGDPLYHRPIQLPLAFPSEIRAQVSKISRQMLHASELSFQHPISGEQCSFTAPLPEDFCDLLQVLAPFRWDL